jgi:hypothetical protein
VLWKDAAGVSTSVTSALIANWMTGKAAEYKAYTDLVNGATYKAAVDRYNYYAAGKAWTKAWALANVDKTIDETVTKQYIDALTKKTNAAGTEITIAPEMPMVPLRPLVYSGPAFHYSTAAQPVSSFALQGGMGMPALGKLGFVTSGGFGHAFGVRGQGNENKDEVSSDTA